MKERDFLAMSEDFYSIQGEGATTGYPAYFIRLMNCNLRCGASAAFMKKVRKGEIDTTPGEFKGDWHEEGRSTWTCDSIPVWIKGHKKPMDYLIDRWREQGIDSWVHDGRVNLIWTGGEPGMPVNQQSIMSFMNYYDNLYPKNKVYHEIETNGTMVLEQEFLDKLDQINCSVKLGNSGHTKEERIKPTALWSIMSHPNYWFKFVISSEDDMNEIISDFIEPFNIDPKRICMMPGMDDRENFHERTAFVLEMAKKYGFIGLTRLHISAWDKTTGV